VLTPDGRLLSRSTAVLHVLKLMNAPWPLAAMIMGVFPAFVRDAVYGVIARIRRRLFSPPDSCALPPVAVRRRLLP